MNEEMTAEPTKIRTFSFGEEQRIINGMELVPYFQCIYNGQYYEPPFSLDAHAKYFYTLLYLRSALQLKADILTSCYVPHPLLSKQQFAKLAIDYLWLGNAYLERVRSRTGKLLALKHSPAKYTRRDKDDRYKFVALAEGWLAGGFEWGADMEAAPVHQFPRDSIFHLMQPDINQELYGVPEWLPAVQSAQLNEAATKFRLRYYNNGSHAGYILYVTDPAQDESDIDALEEALRNSKGPGNFRNLLYYAPNGKADGLKLMPISEVTAKDEFFNIKSISRDDQLATARVPPNIMGIVPTNTSGFGSVTDAAKVFARNEVLPLQDRFAEINDWLGQQVITFNEYKIEEDKSDSS